MRILGEEYELWGEKVSVQLPKLPTPEEIQEIDEISGNPSHGFFQTSHGKLHYRYYLPKDDDIKAVCIWQHGIQAHSGIAMKVSSSTGNDGGKSNDVDEVNRYTNIGLLSRKLMSKNIALYAPDMIGHGFSEGVRFYIPDANFEINRDHLDYFSRFVATKHKGIPIFLMGDSYGGCLALHVAKLWQEQGQQSQSSGEDAIEGNDASKKEESKSGFSKITSQQLHGVCLTAPAIVGDLPPLPIRLFLQYILAPLFPTRTPFFMPHPISPERIWKIEEVRKHHSSPKVKEVGLSAGGVPFRLGTALGLLKAIEHVQNDVIPGFKIPFSVCHGREDWGVKIEGSELLLNVCNTKEEDRNVRFVDGGYHDLMADPTRVENIQFHIQFIEKRISQGKS